MSSITLLQASASAGATTRPSSWGRKICTAGLTLSNGTLNQNGLASMDVNSLGLNVTGSTGGALVSSGSTQPYTATISTGTLGTQHRDVLSERRRRPYYVRCLRTRQCLDQGNAERPRSCCPEPVRLSGNNQTVIVGATGITAGLSLSNGTIEPKRACLVGCQLAGARRSGSTGGKLVASGSIAVLHGSPKHRHAWHAERDILVERRRRPYAAGGVGADEHSRPA